METIVKTKEELKQAKQRGDTVIIVRGNLIKDLIEARKVTQLSRKVLTLLSVGLMTGVSTAPLTNGLSLVAVVLPITTITGISVPAIILVSFLGVSVILAIFNDYTVEIDTSLKSVKLIKK